MDAFREDQAGDRAVFWASNIHPYPSGSMQVNQQRELALEPGLGLSMDAILKG